MDPDDINIEVQDNVLTVSGERRFQEEVKEDKYYRIERRYGSFSRSIALPQTVDESKIEAKYENGVLEVTVPKAEIAKPKKITVAIGGADPEDGGGRGDREQSRRLKNRYVGAAAAGRRPGEGAWRARPAKPARERTDRRETRDKLMTTAKDGSRSTTTPSRVHRQIRIP